MTAEIEYTNWKGETRIRRILPKRIIWGASEWHPEAQWLLEAYDVEKRALRTFALRDIKSWAGVEVPV